MKLRLYSIFAILLLSLGFLSAKKTHIELSQSFAQSKKPELAPERPLFSFLKGLGLNRRKNSVGGFPTEHLSSQMERFLKRGSSKSSKHLKSFRLTGKKFPVNRFKKLSAGRVLGKNIVSTSNLCQQLNKRHFQFFIEYLRRLRNGASYFENESQIRRGRNQFNN